MGMYTHLHYDFALRTKANLEFIEKAYQDGTSGVYNVTQLVNSLLGMVIFLKEGQYLPNVPLNILCHEEHIRIDIDESRDCKKVNQFLRRFRNAIAHCRFEAFGSKDDIQGFTMHDQKYGRPVDWKIHITTQGIRDVAFGLVDYVINHSPNCDAA